jgi:transcriptional regulator with XRE-family HTH domain
MAERLSSIGVQAEAYRQLSALKPLQRRRIRERAGFTARGFAAAMGISEAKLARYESEYTPNEEEAWNYWIALKQLLPKDDEETLTEEERRNVIAHFEAGETCKHCFGIHARACPRVKSLQYHPEGALAKVEFWADEEWPKENVLFRDSPQLREPEDTY